MIRTGHVFDAQTLTTRLRRPWRQVYDFASNPANLTLWAEGLGRGVERLGSRWFIETPSGRAELRFAERNPFGVMDHWVHFADGRVTYVPFRVVANGDGCEVMLTLFQPPCMTEGDHERDAALVRRDLDTLRTLLETKATAGHTE
jgi:hypothetical protein